MSWWRNILAPFRDEQRSITTVEDYIEALSAYQYGAYGVNLGIQQSHGEQRSEPIPNDLVGYTAAGYAGNGVVFACMLARMLVFSGVRFTWQRFAESRPSELFGTPDLAMLERPWVGGTTQDMLTSTILDADLA